MVRYLITSLIAFGVASTCLAADAPCSGCHAQQADHFADTVHGRALGSEDCVSCHGDGQAHVRGVKQGTIMAFDAESSASKSAMCTGCHVDQHAAPGNPHDAAGLACSDCHNVHTTGNTGSLPRGQAGRGLDAASAVCVGCHEDVLTQFAFNEAHRLTEGSVSCTSCHDAHAPDDGLHLGGFGDSECEDCHADKSGPFVFEHGAQRVEGCVACHEPHGSPNRHMLTHQETGELCYTCHAGVPQFHLGFAPSAVAPARFDERTVCTNCHVTIHGSNLDRVFLR